MNKEVKETLQQSEPQNNSSVEVSSMESCLSARHLYWQGWRITAIAKHLLIPRTTLYGWKNSEQWDQASPVDKVEGAIEVRLLQLITKAGMSHAQRADFDLMLRGMAQLAKIKHYSATGEESNLNPKLKARNEAPRKGRKNFLSDVQIEELKQALKESLYPFQKHWYEHRDQRTCFILKSRQIGATWYFAREALLDALETGRNQIFISATKKQARVFRTFMVDWVHQVTGVLLTGEDIMLTNGAELIFLGTHKRSTQTYSGNVYIDEAFWIPYFEELNEVARAMATHKHLRRTYISTPSTDRHEAYALWTGEAINKGRSKTARVEVDLSDALLKEGSLGGDMIWRQKVTLEDAVALGFDRVDIEGLRMETSPEDFANKYGCEFIQEGASAFKFAELQACMVDKSIAWPDYKEFYEHPFSNKPVWLGHDPSATGDNSSLAIVAPPEPQRNLFRVLERTSFKGASFEKQVAKIIAATRQYHVDKIDIDASGIGLAVHELVVKERPDAKAIIYNPAIKMMMVLKAQSLIRHQRLQIDLNDTELLRSFLAIKPILTKTQRRITFDAPEPVLGGRNI